MTEPFQTTFPGDPGAVDAACNWVNAIVRSIDPELTDMAERVVRVLMASAVLHTPPAGRVHLQVTAADITLKIEICDPGEPASDEVSSTSWASLFRDVAEFGTKHIEGQGHLAWVLLPRRHG
ncbi:hypothetical protein ACGFIV_01070 [Sphaerisporangium sp. NPDC049003]|uniref:hypothetical protein n=1 Tax=Sphaerisporangium sp. NPDC049003 TaxID=3364517 RepID=UPI00371E75B0